MHKWIDERDLPINKCGKVIIPQKDDLDSQLDLLAERGRKNGAKVKLIDSEELATICPYAKTPTGRALWSPNTSVTNAKIVISRLAQELEELDVEIFLGQKKYRVDAEKNKIKFGDGSNLQYGHLINCSGLQADMIAKEFDVGKELKLIPFKGIYWTVTQKSSIKIRTNIYPVPDLNLPFLGVHFTPSCDEIPCVSIGPTATPALGRENYNWLEDIEPIMTLSNIKTMASQYICNSNNFRQYMHEQFLLFVKPIMIKQAKMLVPDIELSDIEKSAKVGIRPQLFNTKNSSIEKDFLCVTRENSTHILNAISPAFTASSSLANLVLEKAQLIEKV
ncbi:hypothetical protein KR100_01455 [Synechococcus sp. KORDI-100]|nr:hypothetical protein KR100_01455 [Synechococcus sp. KORDI-100]